MNKVNDPRMLMLSLFSAKIQPLPNIMELKFVNSTDMLSCYCQNIA